MKLEIVKCPVCKQKLALQDYVIVNTLVVCANLNCETNLRIVQRNPAKVEIVPVEATFNQSSRPEAYG